MRAARLGLRRLKKGLSAHPYRREAMKDHVFKPGDPAYNWERQCSVICAVSEDDVMVGAHCGAPPEEHPAIRYPLHSDYCAVNFSDAPCCCWASRPTGEKRE